MRSVIAVLVVAAGCSHVHSTPVDASATSVELACESHAATFPPLEKGCTVDADCFIADHEISCCGTMVAIGLNVSAKPQFATSESACENGFPGCGCASQPTAAEDGRTQAQGTIAVHCDAGLCKTYVP